MTVQTEPPYTQPSDTMDDLAGAKKAIAELLSVLNVNTIVSVDDQYAQNIQKETVVRRLKDSEPAALEALAVATPLLSDLMENGKLIPLEDAAVLVDEVWDDLGSEIHRALSAIADKDRVPVENSPDDQTDLASTASITTLFEETVTVELLSLASWRERAASFAAPSNGGVLVLFDRDFTKESGGATEGDRLATELAAKNLDGVHCGLLTHSVSSFEEELEVARKLPDWPAMSLIVLNKGRLGNPSHFASGIQAALLARGAQSVRDRIAEDLEKASAEGLAVIRRLDAYSMISSIKASITEGVHEFDGPMRIFNSIYSKAALSTRGRLDFACGQLQIIRDVIHLSNSPSELPRPADLEALEQGERYIDGATLSASHLPLEAGDIFEFKKGKRKPAYYLLLVQACDLTIRPDGARAYAPPSFTLAKITDKDEAYAPKINEFELPGHEIACGRKWLLSAATRIQVSPAVLDATVLSLDGTSVIHASMEAPRTATPGFQKRTLKMARECRKILDKYKADLKLAAKGGEQLPQQLVEIITAGNLAGCRVDDQADSTIDLKAEAIIFGIRRVARLNEVTAGFMLRRTSEYHNRPGDRNGLFINLDAGLEPDHE